LIPLVVLAGKAAAGKQMQGFVKGTRKCKDNIYSVNGTITLTGKKDNFASSY